MIRPTPNLALLCAVLALAMTCARAGAQAGMHDQPKERPASTQPVNTGAIGRLVERASPGDVISIEPGTYVEHLRIDKPLTIRGPGQGAAQAIIEGGGSGDIIEIVAPDVTIEGLHIRGTGIDLDQENAAVRAVAPRLTIRDCVLSNVLFGIDLREAPDSIIEGNTIGGKDLDVARRGDGLRLWRADRTRIIGNTIHDGRDAIVWYSTDVSIERNHSHDCRYGLHLMFSDNVRIVDNTMVRNSVGIYLMYSTGVEITGNRLLTNRGPSGYGIGLKETDRFSIRDNLIAGNRSGVYIDGSPFTDAQPGEFTRNTIACNDVGVTFLPSARGNELAENNFIDNIDQVAVAGRGSLDANAFWKGDRGNFWSDYTGYDLNGDGVGDFVHEQQTLFENLMDRRPALRLFLFSPAQQAIEFVGRAIPAVRPEPKFCDEVPLMRPVPIAHVQAVDAESRLQLGLVGLALIGIGAGAVAAAGSTGRRGPSPRGASGAAA